MEKVSVAEEFMGCQVSPYPSLHLVKHMLFVLAAFAVRKALQAGKLLATAQIFSTNVSEGLLETQFP